eukprot:gene24265-29337_t
MLIEHLFVGKNQTPEFYVDYFACTPVVANSSNANYGVVDSNDISKIRDDTPRSWPEKTYTSAYQKHPVQFISVSVAHGIENNEAGYPTHIENAAYRVALVSCTKVYEDYEKMLPGSSKYMKPGVFGENITVSHEHMHPANVCLGDVYRSGSVVWRVTGPRMPCPKVDAYIGFKGITNIGRMTAWTGYFLQALQDGETRIHDELVLVDRPYPQYSMTAIQKGLWGSAEDVNSTEEFLRGLADAECLIPRHYRDLAKTRLEKLRAKTDA